MLCGATGNKVEVANTPEAQKALDVEWKRLRDITIWDEDGVREWRVAAAEARNRDEETHSAIKLTIK